MFQRINYIIDKYIKKYINDLGLTEESANESYNSISNIPKKDNYQLNVRDLKLSSYGKVIVLFTDIKNATSILETCEEKGMIHIYSNYLNYSSKLLGEIIDIFNGHIIESTGDGNYAIINSTNNDVDGILYNKNNQFVPIRTKVILNEIAEEKFYKDIANKIYLDIFDENEKNYILEKTKYISSIDEKLRTLFFLIYANFNIKINDIPLLKENNIKFATRIGCKIGSCQITNIEVKGHINQEKLIGSIVHKAAHQASGKES